MRQKTETMLCAAFMELLKKCPFSKITIQKLAGQCGVNRQTFYYHFDNIYDLMSKAFEYELVHESHIYEEVTWEYAMSRFLQWIKDNRVIIRNILTNAELPYLKKAMYPLIARSISCGYFSKNTDALSIFPVPAQRQDSWYWPAPFPHSDKERNEAFLSDRGERVRGLLPE